MKPHYRLLLAILNLVGFVTVVVVNVLAVTVPLGGKTTAQLSDQYSNLFVPAGLTFSIWGLIYLLLAVFVVYSFFHAIRTREVRKDFMDQIGILFLVTCVANAAWIFSWQYEVVPLSMVLMIVLLLSLIAVYRRLEIGKSGTSAAVRYMAHLPQSVYLGWITVATLANLTAFLVAIKWDALRPGGQLWAVAMMVIGIVLALIVLFARRDVFYTLVVDWAVLGILIKQTTSNKDLARGVIIASIVGIVLLTGGVVVQIARKRVYRI